MKEKNNVSNANSKEMSENHNDMMKVCDVQSFICFENGESS